MSRRDRTYHLLRPQRVPHGRPPEPESRGATSKVGAASLAFPVAETGGFGAAGATDFTRRLFRRQRRSRIARGNGTRPRGGSVNRRRIGDGFGDGFGWGFGHGRGSGEKGAVNMGACPDIAKAEESHQKTRH